MSLSCRALSPIPIKLVIVMSLVCLGDDGVLTWETPGPDIYSKLHPVAAESDVVLLQLHHAGPPPPETQPLALPLPGAFADRIVYHPVYFGLVSSGGEWRGNNVTAKAIHTLRKRFRPTRETGATTTMSIATSPSPQAVPDTVDAPLPIFLAELPLHPCTGQDSVAPKMFLFADERQGGRRSDTHSVADVTPSHGRPRCGPAPPHTTSTPTTNIISIDRADATVDDVEENSDGESAMDVDSDDEDAGSDISTEMASDLDDVATDTQEHELDSTEPI